MSCDMCSKCGGMTSSINYAKQIDPPRAQYGTILGDAPPSGGPRRQQRSSMPAIQMCLPTMAGPPPPSTGHHPPGQQPSIIQVPCDPVKPCPRFICEPCPPPPPTKVWLIKSSPMPQKSVCLPVGGSSNEECSFSDKIIVCLPSAPAKDEPQKPEEKLEPVGLITRNKEMDLIAGKIVTKCTCGRKNGLAGEDCPRMSCQNNPGCTMDPPRCWPQFKLPKPPPPPLPDQDLVCIPIKVVYQEPPPS